MKPVNCHLWQKKFEFDFENIKTYYDHSHFWRNLVKCKRCGQLYVSDSVEFLAWDTKSGQDEIYTVIIPVSDEELKKYDFQTMGATDLVGKLLPQIIWYPDGEIGWLTEEGAKLAEVTGEEGDDSNTADTIQKDDDAAFVF